MPAFSLLDYTGLRPTASSPTTAPSSAWSARSSRASPPVWPDQSKLALRLLHELSHTVVNPLVKRSSARLAKHERLYAPVRGRCADGWTMCADEQLVQAVARAAYQRHDRAEPFNGRAPPDAPEMIYVLVRELSAYEADRRRYPTLKEFFPRLVGVLEKTAARSARPAQFRVLIWTSLCKSPLRLAAFLGSVPGKPWTHGRSDSRR